MVDPNVFEFVKDNGYDPKKVSGFAFGMGVDRLALLKYGVDDIAVFFSGGCEVFAAVWVGIVALELSELWLVESHELGARCGLASGRWNARDPSTSRPISLA